MCSLRYVSLGRWGRPINRYYAPGGRLGLSFGNGCQPTYAGPAKRATGARLGVRGGDRDQDQQDPERERPHGHAVGPRTEPFVHRARRAARARGAAVELGRAPADLHGAPPFDAAPNDPVGAREIRRDGLVDLGRGLVGDRRELPGVVLAARGRDELGVVIAKLGARGCKRFVAGPQLVVGLAGAERLVAAGELRVDGGLPRRRTEAVRRSRSRSCGGRPRRHRAGSPGAGDARTAGPACGRTSPRPHPSRRLGDAAARLGAAPRCRGRRRPCSGPRFQTYRPLRGLRG